MAHREGSRRTGCSLLGELFPTRYVLQMLAKLALCMTLAVAPAACVEEDEHPVTATPMTGPGGGRAWALECDRRADCFWKAGRLCKFGYDIVDSAQETTGGRFAGTRVGNTVVGHVSEDNTNELTVECK
jgi:hypothetical protein